MTLDKNIKRIIISRPDAIGDVLLTLPLTGLLKKYFPEVEIIFLGKTYTAPVIQCCQFVDTFINADTLLNLNDEEAILQLKSLNADVIIHVFPHKKVAMLAKKARIPLRIGTTHRFFHWKNINKFVFLSRKNSSLHEAQLNCKLLEGLEIYEIPDLKCIFKYSGFNKISPLHLDFKKLLDPKKKHVIFHPKSRGSGREWPLSHFKSLIDLLPEEKYQIFITGSGEEEKKILAPWIEELPEHVIDLSLKFSLTEFISFIKEVDFLVAAGTGPLHLAAACGINAIGIFPPTKPIHLERWGPIGKKAHALTGNFPDNFDCNKCQKTPEVCPCMAQVSPESVAELILK